MTTHSRAGFDELLSRSSHRIPTSELVDALKWLANDQESRGFKRGDEWSRRCGDAPQLARAYSFAIERKLRDRIPLVFIDAHDRYWPPSSPSPPIPALASREGFDAVYKRLAALERVPNREITEALVWAAEHQAPNFPSGFGAKAKPDTWAKRCAALPGLDVIYREAKGRGATTPLIFDRAFNAMHAPDVLPAAPEGKPETWLYLQDIAEEVREHAKLLDVKRAQGTLNMIVRDAPPILTKKGTVRVKPRTISEWGDVVNPGDLTLVLAALEVENQLYAPFKEPWSEYPLGDPADYLHSIQRAWLRDHPGAAEAARQLEEAVRELKKLARAREEKGQIEAMYRAQGREGQHALMERAARIREMTKTLPYNVGPTLSAHAHDPASSEASPMTATAPLPYVDLNTWYSTKGPILIKDLSSDHLRNILGVIAKHEAWTRATPLLTQLPRLYRVLRDFPSLANLLREASIRPEKIPVPGQLQGVGFLLFSDAWPVPGGAVGTIQPIGTLTDAQTAEACNEIHEELVAPASAPLAMPWSILVEMPMPWSMLVEMLPPVKTLLASMQTRVAAAADGLRPMDNLDLSGAFVLVALKAEHDRRSIGLVADELLGFTAKARTPELDPDRALTDAPSYAINPMLTPLPQENKAMASKKQLYDANGNPVDADGNRVAVDAEGNPATKKGIMAPVLEAGKRGLKQGASMLAQDTMVDLAEVALQQFFGLPVDKVDQWKRENPKAWEFVLAGTAAGTALAAGNAPEFLPGANLIEAAALHAFTGRTTLLGYKYGSELKDFAKFMFPHLNTLRKAGADVLGVDLPDEFREPIPRPVAVAEEVEAGGTAAKRGRA